MKAIKNPRRVVHRIKDKLTKEYSTDVYIEESVRIYNGNPEARCVLFVKSKYDYGDMKRGLSFEENNFLHTLVSTGYRVVAYDPLDMAKKYGKKRANKMLVEIAHRYNVKYAFFVLFKDEIEIDTLSELKNVLKIKTFNWFTDDHFRFEKHSKIYAPFFSFVITTHKNSVSKYHDIGVSNVHLSQWGCNHYLYRNLCLDKIYDVSLVGQPHGNRHKIIGSLKDAGISVATYGYGWPSGMISTYDMIKVFNPSKINLNLSNASSGSVNQIKGRDFEIPCCGGFLITGEAPNIEEYYNVGSEIVVYRNINDLVDKVRYYLNNSDERELIAKSGCSRALSCHTYEKRFEEIFTCVGDDL